MSSDLEFSGYVSPSNGDRIFTRVLFVTMTKRIVTCTLGHAVHGRVQFCSNDHRIRKRIYCEMLLTVDTCNSQKSISCGGIWNT